MNLLEPSDNDFLLLKLKTPKKTEENTVNYCLKPKVIFILFSVFFYSHRVGLEQYISGVIFYEETLYQKTDEGTQFVDLLKSKGIIPGIKVHYLLSNLTNALTIFCPGRQGSETFVRNQRRSCYTRY